MMSALRYTRPLLAASAVVGVLSVSGVPSASGSAAQPVAAAASTCNISGKEESLGPTYVTYVGVSGGASCRQAERLVRAFYRCRVKHGGVVGHCSGVEGFRCTENRYAKITVQYDSHVLCTHGRERIRHDYTQFT
jgi:hypothetical protein